MYRQRIILTLLLATDIVLPAFGAAPVDVELIEVGKIWDEAPHNAFTDLARWNDRFYGVFRQGRGHVSSDGRIRVLRSVNGDIWESAALVELDSFDLRDAHVSAAPDGRLMLLGGAAPRKGDDQSAPTGSFVSFSEDGIGWSKPRIVVQPGRWH